MPLESGDARYYRQATGWVELGLFNEADSELENINLDVRDLPEILSLRVEIYRGLGNWEAMSAAAAKLTDIYPAEPRWFIEWAFAARRAISIEVARDILAKGEERHPNDPRIQFNLACYESQLGNLDRAKQHLPRATAANDRFKGLALNDPDLAPLWTAEGLDYAKLLSLPPAAPEPFDE